MYGMYYIRHGTTSLFAALDVASGFVIGKCYKRRRAKEFLAFLREIDADVPDDLDIHIIPGSGPGQTMDNYATHKTKEVKAWLARRSHYHVHFTPTSASWINQIECWFAELTGKQLKRGAQVSVKDLEADIMTFVACTRKIRNPTNEPNQPTKPSYRGSGSVTASSKTYVANFKFT